MTLVRAFTERAQVDAIRSRKLPNSDEIEFQQKIWVYKSGSKFPTEYQIRLPSGVRMYPEGEYVFDIQTNIQPDKYMGLSFNPFAPITLTPVTAQFIEAFDKLNLQIYQSLALGLHPIDQPETTPANEAAPANSPLFKTSRAAAGNT